MIYVFTYVYGWIQFAMFMWVLVPFFFNFLFYIEVLASQVVLMVKNLPANAGEMASISESRRSPEGGNGNPLQYLCLENLMDREA